MHFKGLAGLLATLVMLTFADAASAVTVPSTIPADCSSNVQTQLASFINAQPDGSAIDFPANACYAQNDRILISDKSNLTIDGNGSSFKSSAPNDASKVAGNWIVMRGTNVRMTDMKIVGNFHLTGARSQQRVNDITIGTVGSQFNMGIGIYGGTGNYVTDMSISDVFGDGVAVNVAHYISGSSTDPLDSPANTHVERVSVFKAARHCISPSQSDGFWLIDSTLKDCWYGGMDAELDNVDQKLKNVNVLRNHFSDYFMFGLVVPVAGNGENTRDITIRDNVFESRPDNICNDVVTVGFYPSNPATLKNVKVENNTFAMRSGYAVVFEHVAGGSISANKDSNYVEAGCNYPATTPFSSLRNSTGVVVDNNGPTAPGAGGAAPPPPVDPPPAGGCATPTSIAGTRTAGTDYNNANLTWTAVAGATSYKAYIRWSNSQNPLSEYATFTTNSGTLFGLIASKSYDITIQAICGSATSAMSAVFVLPVNGQPPPPPGCAAPTGIAGTRTAASGGYNNADLTFGAVSGATSYKVFIRWTASANPFSEYATFATNSGRLWSLIADKSYDIAIKSVCGSSESPMSATFVLPTS